MLWSHFCGEEKGHIVRESTVKEELGRKVAKTYCNRETTTNVDVWNKKISHTLCGICYRANQKALGFNFNRMTRLGREPVLNLGDLRRAEKMRKNQGG